MVAHSFDDSSAGSAEEQAMADTALHDTYIVWNWALGLILLVAVIVLVLGAAALIKYLFFR
jgi:hypothetical protein